MKLHIRYGYKSFGSWNAIKVFFLLSERDPDYIVAGWKTALTEGIWRLFVDGKTIKGNPSGFTVNLTPREKAVFHLIKKAHWDTQKGFWGMVRDKEISKEAAFKYLKEELPKWVLKNKLDGKWQ